MIWHIIPINDLHEHEDNSSCSCNPTVTELENGYLQVKHNSWDGREYIERLVDSANENVN